VQAVDEAQMTVTDTDRRFTLATYAVIALVLLTTLIVAEVLIRRVAKVIWRMTSILPILSAQDVTAKVPDRDRRDAKGEAAPAFRQSVMEAARPRVEQLQEKWHQVERADVIEASIRWSEAVIGRVMRTISSVAPTPRSAARSMAAAAAATT
jgi:hypothetical protein